MRKIQVRHGAGKELTKPMHSQDERYMFSSIVFLALCIWREVRGESRECQEAVAMCVMNRVQRPKWWGNDPLSVVCRKWQFSSMTDPNDRQLTLWPLSKSPPWTLALEIADMAVSGDLVHPAPNADSFWSEGIDRPYWASDGNFVRKIGKMSFHNVDGDS